MNSPASYLSQQEHQRLHNRIARIEGQISALKSALDRGACADDLILLASAPRGALRQFVAQLLEHHLLDCATCCMEGNPEEILQRVSRTVTLAMKQS